jgi:hypothetical protein
VIGSPSTRLTPPFGAPAQGAGRWGVQPSGPLPSIGGSSGRRSKPLPVAVTGQPMGDARPLGLLPRPSTVSYVANLGTSSLLVIGLAAVLLFGPKRPRALLRSIARRHVGGG